MELNTSQCRAQVCCTANTVEISQRGSAHTAEHLGVTTHKTKATPQDSFWQHHCNSGNAVSIAKAPERITATLKSLIAVIYLFLFVFPLSRGYHLIAAHLSARKTTATRQPCHCLAACCSRFSSVHSPALC